MRCQITVGNSLVAFAVFNNAFASVVLLTGFEGCKPCCLAVFTLCRASVLTILRRRKRGACCSANPLNDLAAARATFSERHFLGAFACRLIPAHARLAGALVPCDRAVAGGCGDCRKQGIS